MKKIILFDIDFTLSNRDFLKKFGRDYLARLVNKTVGEIDETADQAVHESWEKFGIFNINFYSKKIAEVFNEPDLEEKLMDMFLNKYPYEKALYSEVKEVLHNLKEKYILGIQTDGQDVFQLLKIQNIRNYFDEKYIYVFKNKKTEIFDKISGYEKQVTIIDDKPDYIEKLTKNNIRAILINRGNFAEKKDKYEIKESINTLQDLDKIL